MITICIYSHKENIIYNKINNTAGLRPYYPHIFYNHNFAEGEITDNSFYEKAIMMGRLYGNDSIFMSVKNKEALDEFLAELCFCVPENALPDISGVDDFASLLGLSATMRASFIQLMYYYGFTHDISQYLSHIKSLYSLPVSTKKEGKIIYEHIRKEILG